MAQEKRLYLIRHGKSSWGYENVHDIDRPLKNKGIKNAYEMANRLKEKDVSPDLIITSPAVRALHTALIFAAGLNFSYRDIKINEVLYFSDENTILNFLKNTSDAIATLFIFGHNPITTNLANLFFKKTIEYVPTAGVAGFVFETNSWSLISKENVVGEWYGFPKKN